MGVFAAIVDDIPPEVVIQLERQNHLRELATQEEIEQKDENDIIPFKNIPNELFEVYYYCYCYCYSFLLDIFTLLLFILLVNITPSI